MYVSMYVGYQWHVMILQKRKNTKPELHMSVDQSNGVVWPRGVRVCFAAGADAGCWLGRVGISQGGR